MPEPRTRTCTRTVKTLILAAAVLGGTLLAAPPAAAINDDCAPPVLGQEASDDKDEAEWIAVPTTCRGEIYLAHSDWYRFTAPCSAGFNAGASLGAARCTVDGGDVPPTPDRVEVELCIDTFSLESPREVKLTVIHQIGWGWTRTYHGSMDDSCRTVSAPAPNTGLNHWYVRVWNDGQGGFAGAQYTMKIDLT